MQGIRSYNERGKQSMEKKEKAAKVTKAVGMKMDDRGAWHESYMDFYGATEEDAEESYEKWQQDCYGYDTSLPLGDLVEKYIYEILINDRNIRYNTKAEYISAYKNYFREMPAARRPLKNIRAIDLQIQYNQMNCEGRYIRLANTLIGKLYAFLQLQMNIQDITKQVTVPQLVMKSGVDIEVWSDEELAVIKANLPNAPRIRFLIVLLMNTGCRISELLALKYSDIDVKTRTLTINKQLAKEKDLQDRSKGSWFELAPTKSQSSNRRIPLSDYVMEEFEIHKEWHRGQMERYRFETDYIFTSLHGNAIDKRTEIVTFKRFYKRIGVPYRSYHVYRHTFGTNLCRNNVPIQVASKLLGHSSINVTGKYYINVDDQQKIDAINKMTLS